MHRRTALSTLATLSAAAAIAPGTLRAKTRRDMSDREHPFGVQLFTIPKLVEADLPGTLALLAEIGYREVEFFGPYPFSAEATRESWEGVKGMLGLSDNAFYGHSPAEVGAMLRDNGLAAPSVHVDLLSLRENLDALAEGLAPLAPQTLVVPAVDLKLRTTLDDYKRLADDANAIGRRLGERGMAFGYHNHGYEHLELSGETPLDYLLANTDPEHVRFELDVFWMAAAGADPVDYLERYPGRFRLIHLKDAREPFSFPNDGQTPDEWMAGFPLMADPGEGVLDIPAILAAAEASGVEHYYLERDLAPEPVETLRNSYGLLTEM